MEYKDITKHPEILEYYEKGNQILEALGYTDHSTAHTKLEYDLKKRKIILELHIDEKICTMYDYFDIFLDRMTMCSKAARVLDAKFSLVVNEQRVL